MYEAGSMLTCAFGHIFVSCRVVLKMTILTVNVCVCVYVNVYVNMCVCASVSHNRLYIKSNFVSVTVALSVPTLCSHLRASHLHLPMPNVTFLIFGNLLLNKGFKSYFLSSAHLSTVALMQLKKVRRSLACSFAAQSCQWERASEACSEGTAHTTGYMCDRVPFSLARRSFGFLSSSSPGPPHTPKTY